MPKRTKPAGKRPGKRLPPAGKAKTASRKNKSRVPARKMHHTSRSRSPLERAQELVEKAMRAIDPERQFELTQSALELSPDCADAYTMLSRFVADRRQALVLLEQGLKAAQRVLGRERLDELVGIYWRVEGTRPYMRARLALAECQWSLGLRVESVEHLLDMLRLNPEDDQGIRYAALAHLLELNRDEVFDKLVKLYYEPTTFILFAKLLREYRRSGDSPATHKLLAQSIRRNRFVVPLLLASEPLPDLLPTSYSAGTRSEAALYVNDLAHAWKQTPGAITWLRKAIADSTGISPRPAAGPTAPVKKQLLRVVQSYGTIWQASVSRLPTWLHDGDRLVRPWSILVVDHTAHKIIWQEVVTHEPDAAMLFDCLAQAMRKPQYGRAHRPSEIQVRDEPIWNALQAHLQEVGVDCIYRPELEEADYLFAEMQKMMRPERQPPALVDVENFHSSQGASFYAAAADYFRRAPWQRVPSDAVVQVDCPQLAEFGSSRWYAIVLGQAGQTYGLALYSRMGDIQSICGGCCSSGEESLNGTALSMLFSEGFEVPIGDMLAAEQHRWALAGPEAYPMVLCTEDAMQVRVVQPWELQLLEACVRAVPDFVERHPYLEGTVAGAVPETAAQLKFTLSWIEPDAGECGGCGTECGHHE